MASIARRKLTLFSQLKTLNEATSNDTAPVSGPQLEAICKVTYSSVAACSELQDELLVRLKKKHAHTKYKVLRILKHLVEEGHEGFRKDLQRRTEEIRDCQSYRGPPDALHGEEFNKRVREYAEDLLNAVFETRDTGPRYTEKPPSSIASQGIGRSIYESEGKYSPLSGRKMVGFGNSPVVQEPESRMGRLKANIGSLASKAKVASVNAIHKASERLPERYQEKIASKLGPAQGGPRIESHMQPTLATGNYTSASVSSSGVESGTGGGSGGYSAPGSSTWSSSAASNGGPSEFTTDSKHESRLVDEVTTPAGVRIAPPKDALDTFISRCSSLDCHKITSLLSEKIGPSTADKTRLRSLHVIRALGRSNIPGIHDCLASIRPQLQELTAHASTGMRDLSTKILGDLAQVGSKALVATAGTAESDSVSLGAPATIAPAPSGDGLFGGMAMTDLVPPPVAPTSCGGMFGGMVMTESAPSPTAPTDISGMFGGMVLTGSAPSVTAASAAPTSTGGGLLDGFDVMPSNTFMPAATTTLRSATTSAPSGDLIGLTFNMQPVTNPAPTMAPGTEPLSAAGLADLFNMPPAQSTHAPSSGSGNLLVGLSDFSIGHGAVASGMAGPVESTASATSSFSFISTSNSARLPTPSPMSGVDTMLATASTTFAPAPPTAQAQGGGPAFSFVKTASTDDPFSFVSATIASEKR